MTQVKHSINDEDEFMKGLLSGIDDSFFNAVPSPDPSPKKRKKYTEEFEEGSSTKKEQSPLRMSKDVLHRTPTRNRKQTVNDVDIAVLLEGAEDWDWDDMLSPVRKKPVNTKPPKSKPVAPDILTYRCLVSSVVQERSQKLIDAVSEDERSQKRIILTDDWIETDIQKDDILHVIGNFEAEDKIITVSFKNNLVITHPDALLTATAISNALHCRRRPLLSQMLRSTSDVTPALVYGNILHEVTQQCLVLQKWDASSIGRLISETVNKFWDDLFRINITVEEAITEVQKRAKGLEVFGKRYCHSTPRDDAVIDNTRSSSKETSKLAITKIHDIEEDILAPRFGMRGKIDASVSVHLDAYTQLIGTMKSNVKSMNAVMPLEIKTGRTVAGMEHRAQSMLYTILMAERYSNAPSPLFISKSHETAAGGLLYYTHNEDIILVPSAWNELRGLIKTRNELASYMVRRSEKQHAKASSSVSSQDSSDNNISTSDASTPEPFLPPTINQERMCGRCYVSDACMLYKKACETFDDTCAPISDLYELKTGHLTDEHASFFKHWEHLITMEEQESIRLKKELWTLNADEREAVGRCLSDMLLDPTFQTPVTVPTGGGARIHKNTYRFTRSVSTEKLGKNHTLIHGHIMTGDAVTVSVQDNPRLLGLARGFVLDMSPSDIVIGLDHSLSAESIQVHISSQDTDSAILFRIDKDELASGLARLRDNLAQVFYVGGSTNILNLIVDLKPPAFDKAPLEYSHPSSELNLSQKGAIDHCLRARDYALILGMPGTGKTTVVAYMIKLLVKMGKTVLLTSYTHSAVDNILQKLKDLPRSQILRLGNIDKIHPAVRKYALVGQDAPRSAEEHGRQLLEPPVVATTALSIDHALFSKRQFDYCIVDEASQITLPTCLGPLRFSKKFILVGDHFQLPPLVRNKEARKGGLNVSLFRRLSDAHPEAVVDLNYQYRMNEDIMLLSNRLVYDNRLKCGSVEVAQRSLVIPNKQKESCLCNDRGEHSCWIQKLLDESCRAVFVDTDEVPALDSRVGDLVQNDTEARLVKQVVEALLEGGVTSEQIGIISLYRQQIKLISHLLEQHSGVEILTADRSQGRDKDCIIISLVRANPENQIGDLLKDWRRINVAFTRAQSKLIIFGSKKTLQSSPLLSEFFSLMEEHGWVLSLPKGADKLHEVKGGGLSRDVDSKMISVLPRRFGKRSYQDEGEEKGPRTKKASIEHGVLRSRPLLRDVINNS